MSTTVSYKGSTLTTVTNTTKELLTSGTWLEDDITLTDVSTVPTGTKSISITSNGTTTEDVTSYATASITAAVPASAVDTGTKSISISSNGTTTHDVTGYASASVTAAVPNSYSAGDEGKVVSSGALVSQTAHADVTPTTSDQTIDTTTNNSIKVKGDADLVAGNIKKDVEIFGVTGSYEGGGGGSSPISLLDTVTVSSDTRAVNLDLTPYASYDFIMVYLDATLSSADWLYFVQNGSTPSGGSYTNQQIIRQTGIMYEKMKLVGLPDTWHLLPGSNAIVGNKTATTNVYVYTYAANKTIKAGSKFTIYGGNYADL